MATRRLQLVLDLDTGGYTGRLTQAGGALRTFNGTVNQSSRSLRTLGSSFDSLNSNMSSPLQKLRDYVLVLGNIRLAVLNVRDIAVGWVGSLIKQSAEVERLTVLMEGLSDATTDVGRNREAQANLRSLFQMARDSGFEVKALADSFVKFRTGGLDPTNGSMQGLVDAVARFGGTSDVMHRASIAIQQMSGKGVISMEELRQQLGEAVPTAMADMARAAGYTMPQFAKIVSDGVVQAKPALQLMFAEFNRLYAGSGERLANTLTGQMSQFRTNLTELSTYFTGLAAGNTESFQAYVDEQQALLDKGAISLEEFRQRTSNQGGLFQGSISAMRQINEAMRSSEGRKFVADMGAAVNSVAQALMSVGQWIVRWRSEIGLAIQVVVAGFLAVKAVNIGQWLMQSLSGGILAFRNLGASVNTMGPVLGGVKGRLDELAGSLTRVQNIQQLRTARLNEEVTTGSRHIANLTEQTNRLRQLGSDYAANTQIIDRHRRASEAALQAGRQTGRFRDYETGTFISQSRAIEVNNNLIKAGARNRVMAAQNSRQLATAEAALTGAVNTQTAAQGRLTVATAASTRGLALKTAAARAASIAVRGLGMMVNLALGPLGLIAIALYTAAEAAGVFESQADRAAAAAARLMQGLADLEDMKAVAARRDQLTAENKADEATLARGTIRVDDPTGKTAGSTRALTDADRKAIQARLNDRAFRHAQLGQSYRRGQQTLRLNQVGDWESRSQDNLTEYRARRGQQYRTYIKEQEALRDGKKITPEEFDKRYRAASARADADVASFQKRQLQHAIKARDTEAAAGRDTSAYDTFIKRLEEAGAATTSLTGNTDALREGLIGTGKAAGGAGKGLSDSEKAAKKAATAYDNARDRYANMIGNQAGQIADLKAEVEGGEGALAQFEARLKNGMFDDATAAELAELRDGFKEIDRLNEQLDFNRTFGKLGKDLAQANAEAEQLWASLKGGTWEADQRATQIRSQFAGMLEGVTDPDKLEQIQQRIEQIVTAMQRADAAEVMREWETMQEDILISLMNEDAARQANFEREVQRQRDLIDWSKLSAEQRAEAERRFMALKDAMYQRHQRDSENHIVRQAREWAKLGQNIDQALAGALNNFVDGLAEGELNFGEFATSIIKELIKVILKAMIAYAILSAIGMTPTNGDGSKMSMGQFIRGGVADFGGSFRPPANSTATPPPKGTVQVGESHTGGLMGRGGSSWVDAHVFNAAKKLHDGGWIGGRQLAPGEVPIIGLEDELVLTQEQQGLLGRRLAVGSGGAPIVKVNVINNSNTALDAEQGEPEWNGKEMIVNVIVEEAQKQGPLRDVLGQIGKGG